jgi:hypothetical protein
MNHRFNSIITGDKERKDTETILAGPVRVSGDPHARNSARPINHDKILQQTCQQAVKLSSVSRVFLDPFDQRLNSTRQVEGLDDRLDFASVARLQFSHEKYNL